MQTRSEIVTKPSALHCAACLAIAAWLGGIGAADAASSKKLTLLPSLSANATTRDVFQNSSSQIQLCVPSRDFLTPRVGLPSPPGALIPIMCWAHGLYRA